jgi:hypothetical protein
MCWGWMLCVLKDISMKSEAVIGAKSVLTKNIDEKPW